MTGTCIKQSRVVRDESVQKGYRASWTPDLMSLAMRIIEDINEISDKIKVRFKKFDMAE